MADRRKEFLKWTSENYGSEFERLLKEQLRPDRTYSDKELFDVLGKALDRYFADDLRGLLGNPPIIEN